MSLDLRKDLSGGKHVRDADFDRLYPPQMRYVSGSFWTPLEVARTAAAWLTQTGQRCVLDVGAGVGKFCIVGAAMRPDTLFVGVEHRPHLVELARRAARFLALDNVMMVPGTITAAPWKRAEAFYLFNPFAENHFGKVAHLDETVELSPARFRRDVAFTERCLRALPAGARVATYHGFGGVMSADYAMVHGEPKGLHYLKFWARNQQAAPAAETDAMR